jgi:hypothetical protein
MSAYHSTELCYLSTVYIDLLIKKRPLDLFFKPYPNAFKERKLYVSPDILPPGSVHITKCTVDGREYNNFNAAELYVTLPQVDTQVKVKVTLTPQ